MNSIALFSITPPAVLIRVTIQAVEEDKNLYFTDRDVVKLWTDTVFDTYDTVLRLTKNGPMNFAEKAVHARIVHLLIARERGLV